MLGNGRIAISVLHSPEGTVVPDIDGISRSGEWITITLRNSGLYTIIEF